MPGVRIPGKVQGFFINGSRNHSRDATTLLPIWTAVLMNSTEAAPGTLGGAARSNAA